MKPIEQASLLAQIPLFSTLPMAELEHLAGTLRAREFLQGELLMEEGKKDDHFYILMEGEVEVIKALGTPDERLLGIRQGQIFFGEMSLFNPEGCHTASVRARSVLQTLEMTRSDFNELLHRQPSLVYAMMSLMSRRLEESENTTILDLREKNRQLTLAYQELKEAQAQLIVKEKLEKELAIARQIQESILPDELPPLQGFDIAALTIPARAVGGDYYDCFALGEDRVGLVVGDACDKGIPAALFINLTNSLVRVEAPRNPAPDDTLRLVNQHLMEMNRSGMFATLLYGVLDTSGRFDYCRAGHPYPLVLDAGMKPVITEGGPGMALGLMDEIVLDARSVTIPEGGMAVLFSDGLSEAMDPDGNEFGDERLQTLLPAAGHRSAAEICSYIWDNVQEFNRGEPQSDDFTVVVIKRV